MMCTCICLFIMDMLYWWYILSRFFGDTPSSVYSNYVVLQVVYGQTYVEVAYDDGFFFRGGSGWGYIGRELMSSPRRITWGCRGVTTWLTQANTSVGQCYFQVLNNYNYIYYVFFNIHIYCIQKNTGGL